MSIILEILLGIALVMWLIEHAISWFALLSRP